MTQALSASQTAPTFSSPQPFVEPSPRWVRVKFNGQVIADTKRALLLIHYPPNGLPTYYFPQADVRMDLLEPCAPQDPSSNLAYMTIRNGDAVAENAAWIYRNPSPELAALHGYVSFEWNKRCEWFEGEQIFVHARDPHKRVDVVASSRHVRVVIAGETVADTRQPRLLFETSLPTRYYIPPQDVRMDLLEPSRATSSCPYKGNAIYWSAKLGEQVVKNVVWSYPEPILENPKIKGLLCFYNERVDIYLDGELQPRPHTEWSK